MQYNASKREHFLSSEGQRGSCSGRGTKGNGWTISETVKLEFSYTHPECKTWKFPAVRQPPRPNTPWWITTVCPSTVRNPLW
eukprot:scaffold7303_cov153-Amphora_coffeaeformis.AAC.3